VVLVALAFRCAKTSAAFAPFEVPLVTVVTLPVLLLLEVSTGSEPTFPADNIFFPAVGGINRGEYVTFISSKTRLTRR
jgi:hypothetical protein